MDAGGQVAALLAISRLLALGGGGDEAELYDAIVREARACLGAERAVLVVQGPGRDVTVLAGAAAATYDLDDLPGLAGLLDRRLRLQRSDRVGPFGPALLLRLTEDAAVIVTTTRDPAPDVATAFADAAGAALERVRAVAEHEHAVAQQKALTRAAKALNESLDLDTVLQRLCHEAAGVLGAEIATVYRGTVIDGLDIAAEHGLGADAIGWRLPPGAGLAGKILLTERAMLTNDYQRIAALPADAPIPALTSAMGAPMVWDGELRGVLTVGYLRDHVTNHEDLAVLETIAELAASACANATAHEGLVHAARTDGLTGCLNHAALQEGLRSEIERATRGDGAPLSLVLVDLDHFKAVNEAHGHLAGDEVLRRAGHALRAATRPYDLAARYGGDEFALVAVDADEQDAAEVARRALGRMGDAIGEFLPPGGTPGTAGVAEWSAGTTPAELIARADRALLHAKHSEMRGQVVPFSAVPDHFRPGRFVRDRGLPAPPPMPAVVPAASDARLRKRTRQLALANALGARLAAMMDAQAIQETAVDELHRAFGYFSVATVRLCDDDHVEPDALRAPPAVSLASFRQHRDDGLIGRCLRTRRPVLCNDALSDPEFLNTPETPEVRAELVVPLWVGGELWGVLNVEETTEGAFDQDDLMLIETVAAMAGSAMRSATLYEQLERAYLGTAEALAAALEAKDSYTADHARSVVVQAEAIGRELGLGDGELRDLRFAAVFHDIGKIAVPEAILNKPGPLTKRERAQMEQHTVAGEQILAPVEFLAGVGRIVRHEHERYDGAGYPDGLAGEDIPLGSRIVLVCDALHAMTSDRPYRRALPFRRAVRELRRNAGAQFDPRVVDTLLDLLERDGLDTKQG